MNVVLENNFSDYKVVDILQVDYGCCEIEIVEGEMFVLMVLCMKYKVE